MDISAISGLDNDQDNWSLGCNETIRWNGKVLQLLDAGKNNGAAFSRVIAGSFDRPSSTRMKPMGSVGGGAAASTDKEGNVEVTVDGHVGTKSDDGNTTFTVNGEVAVDQSGNVSAKAEVRIEHEF